jgi:uncharacterized protein YdbL (DUF1318 family)
MPITTFQELTAAEVNQVVANDPEVAKFSRFAKLMKPSGSKALTPQNVGYLVSDADKIMFPQLEKNIGALNANRDGFISAVEAAANQDPIVAKWISDARNAESKRAKAAGTTLEQASPEGVSIEAVKKAARDEVMERAKKLDRDGNGLLSVVDVGSMYVLYTVENTPAVPQPKRSKGF